MKNKFFITTIFFLLLSYSLNTTNAQQVHKIFDVPGGGSGSTNSSSSSDNDSKILYIVGGAVIVGVVVYALLQNKKENKKQDTTAVILNNDFLEKNLTVNDKLSNMKSQIPVNILFGFQSDRVLREEKRYFVGLNYNF